MVCFCYFDCGLLFGSILILGNVLAEQIHLTAKCCESLIAKAALFCMDRHYRQAMIYVFPGGIVYYFYDASIFWERVSESRVIWRDDD